MNSSYDPLLTVTFGDSEMTYIQYIVMIGNNDLLKRVLEQSDGREQFLQSRDQFENSSLHYVYLMDMKETMGIIIRVMQELGKEHNFGRDLAKLEDHKNNREQKAYATAIKTKSEVFEKLHEALETIKKGGWLSLDHGYNQMHAASMIVSRYPVP